MRHRLAGLILIALLALMPSLALADDWTAIRLRGVVEQMVDGAWKPLILGAVVPDDRPIRTGPDGHVDFRRDQDQISLGANTQIQIKDEPGRRFTTIKQDRGTVESDVDVQNVEHFSVETPYLAAVVKGTHFTVESGSTGSSVSVARGIVAVASLITQQETVLTVGQSADIEKGASLKVRGSGKLPPILLPDDSTAASVAPDNAKLDLSAAPTGQVAQIDAPADDKVKLIPAAKKEPGIWPLNLKSNEYGPVVILGGILLGIIAGGVLLILRRFFG